MGHSEPSYLVVGHLNKAHGTKGEIFVWPLTDHPEGTFAPGVILYLGDETGNRPDSSRPTVSIQSVRPYRRGYLICVDGVTTRDGAEELSGLYVLRPMEELEEAEAEQERRRFGHGYQEQVEHHSNGSCRHHPCCEREHRFFPVEASDLRGFDEVPDDSRRSHLGRRYLDRISIETRPWRCRGRDSLDRDR